MLAEGFGSYLEQITFDEKKGALWTINDKHLMSKWEKTSDEKRTLPSDVS